MKMKIMSRKVPDFDICNIEVLKIGTTSKSVRLRATKIYEPNKGKSFEFVLAENDQLKLTSTNGLLEWS